MSRRRRSEHGVVLIEAVVVSFAVLAICVPVLSMAARLTDARTAASLEAESVASWVARHGDLPSTDDRFIVDVQTDGNTVVVTANTEVEVIGIGGARINVTVGDVARAPISPYRSSP